MDLVKNKVTSRDEWYTQTQRKNTMKRYHCPRAAMYFDVLCSTSETLWYFMFCFAVDYDRVLIVRERDFSSMEYTEHIYDYIVSKCVSVCNV